MTNAYKDEGMRLAPCPFCGEVPDPEAQGHFPDSQGTKWGNLMCSCSAMGPEVRTGYKPWTEWRAAAIQAWNTRAALEAHLSKEGVPEVVNALQVSEAIHAAASAIYFDDSSDYEKALWSVLRQLAPDFADLLEANPRAAYELLSASPLPSPAPQEGVAPDGVPPHPEASDGACNSTVGNERANGENT
jgi:hypothetical protein